MAERQHEGEPLVAAIDMADHQLARAEKPRQAQPYRPNVQEVVVAVEMQRAGICRHPERDAEAATEILLEPRRPGELLAAMDHLRESAGPAVDPHPELTAARGVLGHRDDRD